VFYAMLILVVFGMPVALLGFLLSYQYRGRLFKKKSLSRYGILYEPYKQHRYWYELVVLLRRGLMILVTVVFINDQARQYVALSLTTLGSLMVHTALDPFGDGIENRMESASLAILTAVSTVLVSSTVPLASSTVIPLLCLLYIPGGLFVIFVLATRGRVVVKTLRQMSSATSDGHHAEGHSPEGLSMQHRVPKHIRMCDECEDEAATVHCNECQQDLCTACNQQLHRQGKRAKHMRIEIN